MRRIVLPLVSLVLLSSATSGWAQVKPREMKPLPSVKPNAVILCQHANYTPPCLSFAIPGDADVFQYTLQDLQMFNHSPEYAAFNNEVSSILVGSDVMVYLFDSAYPRGLVGDLKTAAHIPALSAYNLDNAVSSLAISWKPESQRAPAITVIDPAPKPPAVTIRAPAAPIIVLEPRTDRPGHDYEWFDLEAARPEICRDACLTDPKCKAFTFVRPSEGHAPRCYLKNDVPRRVERADCCVSGVKKGDKRY